MKHPRHRLASRNYRGKHAYFLTICSAERRRHFTDSGLTEALIESMHEQFTKHDFSVLTHCFMPDHCHVLAMAHGSSCELGKAVRGFKGVSVPIARRSGIHELWQRDYYEHILRKSDDLISVACYILQNPMRAGLIDDWRQWPYLGCVLFPWRKSGAEVKPFEPPWKSGNRSKTAAG